MEQLSFLPDVAAKPIKSKQTSQQLSLIPPTAYMKPSKPVPKAVINEPKCSFEGKTGKILRRFTENYDGLILSICRVEFDDRTIQDVLEKDLEIL